MDTLQIFVTSAAGDKETSKPNLNFSQRTAGKRYIEVFPARIRQTITGIGSSFTKSSAFVLAHLDDDARTEIMHKVYSQKGANFSLARTHIGSCDFCVDGRYSYADIKDDKNLKHFTVAVDKQGFNPCRYPGISDSTFDLLPMIQQANEIKQQQGDELIRIIASAWTAPAWMKDIEDWYLSPTDSNDGQGTGGQLKPEYQQTYANYLVKYLEAYCQEGVPIWAITPVNEPHGNHGQWESMHFTPEGQRDFIKYHLGPALQASSYSQTRLLIYDQNRDQLAQWANTILSDREAAAYVYGSAIHWYESTYKVYEDVLEQVHAAFPAYDIIHTEGCIDDLGKPAPAGVMDPERFQETGWFGNDDFWWNDNATDWAYSATWAPNVADHPIYTPVHRYARNIIQSLNHWVSGWVDWNIVLDQRGGPNHVGNFCGAPIMIDTNSKEVYYTPIFHVLAQFSCTIRPGDNVVQLTSELPGLDADALHACATINQENVLSIHLLNTTQSELLFDLKIGENVAGITIPANAVQTVQVQLGAGST
jgi:glucosylceramidase